MKFINIFLFIFFVSATLSEEWIIKPGLNAQDEIQEALILAEPGDKSYCLKEHMISIMAYL